MSNSVLRRQARILALVVIMVSSVLDCGAAQASIKQHVLYELDDELFLKLDNEERQITHDGLKKGVWALSEDDKKIVYTVSPEQEFARTNTIVIADTAGHKLHSYTLNKVGAKERFARANKIEWIDSHRIGVEYRVTAQCNQYIIVDTEGGGILANYFGFLFAWSPDAKQLSYVGWEADAPIREQQHSYFLKIDDSVVYPQNQPNPALGNHIFLTPLVWSNDSKNVAFVDKDGRSRLLVAASASGPVIIKKLPFDGDVRNLMWMGKRALRIQSAKHAYLFDLDQNTLNKI